MENLWICQKEKTQVNEFLIGLISFLFLNLKTKELKSVNYSTLDIITIYIMENFSNMNILLPLNCNVFLGENSNNLFDSIIELYKDIDRHQCEKLGRICHEWEEYP